MAACFGSQLMGRSAGYDREREGLSGGGRQSAQPAHPVSPDWVLVSSSSRTRFRFPPPPQFHY